MIWGTGLSGRIGGGKLSLNAFRGSRGGRGSTCIQLMPLTMFDIHRDPNRPMARSRPNSAGLCQPFASPGGPRRSTPPPPLNARGRQEISRYSRDADARKTDAEALLSADLPQTYTAKQELFISSGTHAERVEDPHLLRLDIQHPLTMYLFWSCSADSAPTVPISCIVSSRLVSSSRGYSQHRLLVSRHMVTR
ncbi:hypothetical protein OH76DRAFT_1233691 [Lentinus brumalis]|uniref:Uncharacterized protein n=1 Tax=Lentinus brumalis TaxID=2498619 RepID=A0A371CSG8_9APHY|nr:hypothetical protein OH76DRAFT_1233691 [Polyporus brumalis]